jgi:hypothetical protein
MAMINTDKYSEFHELERNNFEALSQLHENFKIVNVEINIPNNPTEKKSAKLITYFTGGCQ